MSLMKTCSYCGHDNPDEQTSCRECGTDLVGHEPQSAEKPEAPVEYPDTAHLPSAPFVDLSTLENAFAFEEGFSRPNWNVIRRRIEETVGPEDLHQAWSEVALQWVIRLRDELGGHYHVTQSNDFILLCALGKGETKRVFKFAEHALITIREQLKDVAWRNFHGKHVILLFTDDDDYYQHQAPYMHEGVNVRSSGMFLEGGYAHITLAYGFGNEVHSTIAHELAHNCVAHLPLPLWLNEGVAMRVERFVTGRTEAVPNSELIDEHRNFWTKEWIQYFWASASFHDEHAQSLSYSLAEILVQMLAGDHNRFLEFLRRAHYVDAGQTAALDCLGINLGDAVATFLGPGDWRPYRKAIADVWNGPAETKEPAPTEGE